MDMTAATLLMLLFLVNPNPNQMVTTFNDPFQGTFNMVANGQSAGTVVIQLVADNNYRLTLVDGSSDDAVRSGNELNGYSLGVPFKISVNGDNLVMELMGARIDLVRIQAQSQDAPPVSVSSGNIDERLIGIWSNSTAYNSGNAGMASQTLLAFLADGTVESQRSFSSGGDGWSSGKTTDPIERSTYNISQMTPNGGICVINGQAIEYEFYTFGGEQKLRFGNFKTPWVRVK